MTTIQHQSRGSELAPLPVISSAMEGERSDLYGSLRSIAGVILLPDASRPPTRQGLLARVSPLNSGGSSVGGSPVFSGGIKLRSGYGS